MKRILSAIALVASVVALIIYANLPLFEFWGIEFDCLEYLEGDNPATMIAVTVLFLVACIIGSIIALVSKKKTASKIMVGLAAFTAVCCFSAKGFIITHEKLQSFSSYFEIGAGTILAGVVMLGCMGLHIAAIVQKEEIVAESVATAQNDVYATVSGENAADDGFFETKNQAPQVPFVDDKQNNVTRFLLTFFLGWLGSVIINNSSFKPRGYASRSCAYFFLAILTLGIYPLIASIANLTFDPMKPDNIGYYRDGTPLAVQPEPLTQTVSASSQAEDKKENRDFDKQMEQLVALKSLLDQGILTQEEFDAKKKQILGL